MKPRRVLDKTLTPDGDELELAVEHGHYIIRVDGVPLMSSGMSGSEEAMATFAREALGTDDGARILIGGLGLGFTLKATLAEFKSPAQICVAELLEPIVEYHRLYLGDLTRGALDHRLVNVFVGDVREKFTPRAWDVILMDVDNGPEAFTARSNHSLYGTKGLRRMTEALAPGGVLIVWSAHPSPPFLDRLRATGLTAEARRVRARWPIAKGPTHTLFIAQS